MADVLFTYPRNSRSLRIDTGANRIGWAYNLNTQVFPTYGGEVVQVLSTNIDTLTIQGDVLSYEKMEEIYKWFLFYIEDATQGYQDEQGYSELPVTMTYPERGWRLLIQPIALPGLKYGRNVAVPQWQLQAHVIDPDPEMTQLTINEGVEGMGTFREGLVTADIGFRLANPFSDPLGKIDKALGEDKLGITVPDPTEELEGSAKELSKMLDSYTQADFSTIIDQRMATDASKPTKDAPPTKDSAPKSKPGKKST